jgi:hypothetical protein
MAEEYKYTIFEMEEEVCVPAGDGKNEQWKKRKDLQPHEIERYHEGCGAAMADHLIRMERYKILIAKASKNALSPADRSELRALDKIVATWNKVQDRRNAAIDRDRAAGKYWGR